MNAARLVFEVLMSNFGVSERDFAHFQNAFENGGSFKMSGKVGGYFHRHPYPRIVLVPEAFSLYDETEWASVQSRANAEIRALLEV